MRRDLVVIAGSLAQKPRHGGHAWALLQYALGFRELGWDILFIDRISSSACVDATGQPAAPEDSVNARYLRGLMRRFDLDNDFALIVDDGRQWIGAARDRVFEEVRRSAFLLNIMGFLEQADLLAAAPRRVFLDIDPGFAQMWKALGLHDSFAGHDTHVTIGERIGEPDCTIPVCGIEWIVTAQPVVLSFWPVAGGTFGRFTSVASWRGAYGPIDYGGKTYGLRVHEFRRFLDVPRRSGLPFEMALDIDPGETRDLERLEAGGWTLVDPTQAAGDTDRYRDYIQGSGAEFMVAKNMYVETRCGWLSDRSLCYLASGKPVLAQDTGWPALYPSGDGLVSFDTLEEAESGSRSIAGDYTRHSKAARALAEQYFDSKRILTRLLAALRVA
jgi:hypothetical protein